jgi:AraC-like DNA-binding protein
MDVLADFLNMVGTVPQIGRSIAGAKEWVHDGFHPGPASDASNRSAQILIYAVARGEMRLSCENQQQMLVRGDVVFLPDDVLHRANTTQEESIVLTTAIEFSSGPIAIATLSLPTTVVLRGRDNSVSKELVERLSSELRDERGGWETVSKGIVMSLFVEALRSNQACSNTDGGHGWLRGMSDPEIGHALKLMHQTPEHRWTVAELAERLSISRSAFAERFKSITGRPPLEYLTWWRLQCAATRLRSTDELTISDVARGGGYQSDAAFGKAFRREFGMSPGQFRRLAIAKKHTPSQLQLELKKRNPFDVPEQEAGLNLMKTAETLKQPFVSLMTDHGLAGLEYNILRVLRGTGANLSHDELLSQLLYEAKGIPESLQRLVSKRHIRINKTTNRYSITKRGLELLSKLDEPIIYLHRRQFSHFSAGEIAELNRLLVKARSPAN